MNIGYYKRYRMELDLTGWSVQPPAPPPPFRLIQWNDTLLDAFAQAKYLSFRNELDANVFPCLGEFEGCRRLMTKIVQKPGFLPEATWLAISTPDGGSRVEYCGTVQGVRDKHGLGGIQNLGVVPNHRNLGLGACLLLHALAGFARAGVARVYLEVTAGNDGAMRLYRRIGFQTIRVIYKAVEAECTT